MVVGVKFEFDEIENLSHDFNMQRPNKNTGDFTNYNKILFTPSLPPPPQPNNAAWINIYPSNRILFKKWGLVVH